MKQFRTGRAQHVVAATLAWGCMIATMISSPIRAESKSVRLRGAAMNGSANSRVRNVLAWVAIAFVVMVTTLLPACGQQEVNPTWYDPWPGPNTVVAHSSELRAAMHRDERTVRSVSPAPGAGKLRRERATTQSSQLTPARTVAFCQLTPSDDSCVNSAAANANCFRGKVMKRTGKFVTAEELAIVNTARTATEGDPKREVELLRRKYGLTEGCGLDTNNGDFVMP